MAPTFSHRTPPPARMFRGGRGARGPKRGRMTMTAPRTIAPFRNEPIRDFSDPADRRSLEEALARARTRLGRRYPLVVGGERLHGARTVASLNPARPSEVVGEVDEATPEQVSRALDVATEAFASWKRTAAEERADFLFRAAARIREAKDDWNALLVLEVGKPWIEADADTAEAIDFLEFYAREALRYASPPPLTPIQGERNRLVYLPLGVGVVIPPWNFAFAIMAGMTSAALVTGNTVVLKPSSDSAVVAAWFVELLHEVGVPAGVVNFVPGSGSEIGDAIVEHPLTRFIAFTGSKEVGLRVNERAAKTQPGQKWIKRVVAEMGGKDSIVVAADADVDAAVEGVAVSALGFQGQKCSACSRAVVDQSVYDEFLEKLQKRVAKITVGDTADKSNYMGPVVNERALKSIQKYIETGKREGRVIFGGNRIGTNGYFLEPTVIADVAPDAVIAQEEIFGPVLAVIKARDYDHALEIANNTEFGLTGAV